MRRAGIVLCGGRSLRMGRPKALLPWFGRTLVEHVVARLVPCVDEVLVVTARDLPLDELVSGLGAHQVLDREVARGPLAALRDGLAAARAERAFVTTTDAPFLEAADVDALFARAEANAAGVSAVIPRAEGFLQVLSAVYSCRAWLDAEGLLESAAKSAAARGAEGDAADAERAHEREREVGDPTREASPLRLLERIGFEAVEEGASSSPRAWTGFNTPDEYLALARRHDPAASASIEWAPKRPRVVPIGRLGEVLRAVAPSGFPLDDADVLAGLALELGAGGPSLRLEGLRQADLALPIGPGERIRVRAR